jgi:hypothetical protein
LSRTSDRRSRADALGVGLLLIPAGSLPGIQRSWSLSEASGVAHCWTFDHYRWREAPQEMWYGSTPVLAMAALTTSRISFGSLVMGMDKRHPLLVAQEALTLAVMSAGRYVQGLGAGNNGRDATMSDGTLSTEARSEAFKDYVTAVNALTSGRTAETRSHVWRCREASLPIPSTARVPLAVATNAPAVLGDVAAQADMWVTNGGRPGVAGKASPDIDWLRVADMCGQLDELRSGQEPQRESMRKLLLVASRNRPNFQHSDELHALARRAISAGFSDLVVPAPWTGGPWKDDRRAVEDFLSSLTPDGAYEAHH